jgi:hypothetical protein
VKCLRKYRCDACHQSLDKVPQAPMLHDHVWGRLVGPQEKLLCAPCLFGDEAPHDMGVAVALEDEAHAKLSDVILQGETKHGAT